MPELPEVHTTATILDKLIKSLVITDVWSGYNSVFHKGKKNIKDRKYFDLFRKEVIDQNIVGVSRRGKNVLINIGNNKTILVHMKMTGHLLYGTYKRVESKKFKVESEEDKKGWEREDWRPVESESEALKDPFNRFIRLVFSFSNNKHLILSDVRKFAKVCLLPTDKLEESADLREIGPEPLGKSFDFNTFSERLYLRPKAKIKTVLMDQSILAGVGNIYSDEALWLTGIHPESTVEKIPEKNLNRLYKNVILVLKKGIDFRGDSTSDYRNPNGMKGDFQNKHNVYRLRNKACKKKDGGIIKRIVVGTRSAHFCPVHQKLFTSR